MDRSLWLARYFADCGADCILFTYSALGPRIETAAENLGHMPALKANQAMFPEALAFGGRFGLLAKFALSLSAMFLEWFTIS